LSQADFFYFYMATPEDNTAMIHQCTSMEPTHASVMAVAASRPMSDQFQYMVQDNAPEVDAGAISACMYAEEYSCQVINPIEWL
jgi:hypothetical protein